MNWIFRKRAYSSSWRGAFRTSHRLLIRGVPGSVVSTAWRATDRLVVQFHGSSNRKPSFKLLRFGLGLIVMRGPTVFTGASDPSWVVVHSLPLMVQVVTAPLNVAVTPGTAGPSDCAWTRTKVRRPEISGTPLSGS